MGGLYEETDGVARKYYAVAGMTLAASDPTGMKFLLTDHLGSVAAVTDSAGALLDQQRYMPFGKVRPNVGTITQTDFGKAGPRHAATASPGDMSRRDYTGQRSLLTLGLMDYKARMYDAGLGRFIQPDSIIPNAADPQRWNRYTYVRNSPLVFVDPTGHREACGITGEACERTTTKAVARIGGDEDSARAGRGVGIVGRDSSVDAPATVYNDWENDILDTLESTGDSDAQYGVSYIRGHGIRIKVGSVLSPKGWFGADAWFTSDSILLNPAHYSDSARPDAWGLSLVVHEAKHIEQVGMPTKYDELEAWQIGIRAAKALGHYGEPGQAPPPGRDASVLALPLKKDAETIEQFSSIVRSTSPLYYLGFQFLQSGVP